MSNNNVIDDEPSSPVSICSSPSSTENNNDDDHDNEQQMMMNQTTNGNTNSINETNDNVVIEVEETQSNMMKDEEQNNVMIENEDKQIDLIAEAEEEEEEQNNMSEDEEQNNMIVINSTISLDDTVTASSRTTPTDTSLCSSTVITQLRHNRTNTNTTTSTDDHHPTPILSSITTITKKVSQAKESYSLYRIYELEVDEKQGNKALEIVLCSFGRPHMRAFHFSWMCFFVAYVMWFGLAPLINDVRFTLQLTTEDIWTAHITSMGGALFLRLFSGPMCDQWGARLTMGWTLIAASIPSALTGLSRNGTDLAIFRFFSGFAGSAFVPNQYWTSTMFTKEVAGTANAIAAGWGNVGGGVAPLLMGTLLFPAVKAMGASPCTAWRTLCAVPAVVSIIMGILCIKYTDDCPRGYYKQLKRRGIMSNKTTTLNNFWIAAYNRNTWMLFIQYAMCLGVELTMNSATVLYLMDKHELTTEQAGAVASLFGFTNLFARGLGGYISDWANLKYGMRGRLIVQTLLLLGEGIFVWFFVFVQRLAPTIVLLIVFSLFVQATEGSTYGILPYVNPHVTGSVAGIVGAGGNVGAIVFGICFRQFNMDNYHWAFMLMAIMVCTSTLCSLFISIPGLAGLCCGEDCDEAIKERKEASKIMFRNESQYHGGGTTAVIGTSSASSSNNSSRTSNTKKSIQKVVKQSVDDFHPNPTTSSNYVEAQ